MTLLTPSTLLLLLSLLWVGANLLTDFHSLLTENVTGNLGVICEKHGEKEVKIHKLISVSWCWFARFCFCVFSHHFIASRSAVYYLDWIKFTNIWNIRIFLRSTILTLLYVQHLLSHFVQLRMYLMDWSSKAAFVCGIRRCRLRFLLCQIELTGSVAIDNMIAHKQHNAWSWHLAHKCTLLAG